MRPRGSTLARRVLQLVGWRVIGTADLPPRSVLIAFPHTSNWDFPLGILWKAAVGVDVRWVGKDSLFRGPLGPLMRALGGIPVNRRAPAGFVDSVAAQFARSARFTVAVAPEGTRSLTPGWKSGFYRMALAARVALLLGVIDYGRREVGIVGCVDLSGDEDADMARVAAAYAGRCGGYPAKQSPIKLVTRR
ncbi:MAG: 1-acyl-sn-glycerol-3-phosphate acyltransferase [Rhodocyclales bacterium]|nr:1-acyl-sn-glycerol-3-phosphate acyltransferase [Rhodocyclales bacterium]